LAHGVLLVICVWMALDPMFSPHRKGLVIPDLDYLSALCVGYFTGYFLLVFKPLPTRMGRSSGLQTALNRLSQWGVWALLILVPLGLVCKNLPQVRVTNGSALKEYASLLVQKLPTHAVVLCDSESAQIDYPQKLWLVEAWLARIGKTRDYMLLDTLALQVSAYHGMMQRRYGDDFPVVANPKSLKKIPDAALVKLALKLSEQHPIYYLHPSFGYYFEFFYAKPHGLVMEMSRYPTNMLSPPPLTDGQVAENEKFWKERQQTFATLLPWISEDETNRTAGIGPLLSHWLHIPFQPNATAVNLGRFYSQALDYWGVKLQQLGRLREAGRRFDSALELNPANLVAKINGDANQELQAGHLLKVPSNDVIRQELGKYANWPQIIRDDGPFDDPTHCFAQALVFSQGNLLRQAMQQFDRIRSFDLDNALARFWLARFYANSMPDKSLTLVAEMRAHPDTLGEARIRQQDLSVVEAMALFYSHKTLEAEQVLQNSMAQHPGDEDLLATVAQISSRFGRVTNTLSAVERELAVSPTNMAALVIEGYLQMWMSNYSKAIPPLTRALSIDSNNYTARFDRAIANLRLDQLDQAQQDYRILEIVFPSSFKVYYGLGEIAWRRKDTNAAIRYYRLYLTNSIPETQETKMITERLQSLTPAPP
ncbi:MAG: tetratricopeptide repeat protein, partial [Verrucomicrobiota bacterium]